MKTPVHITVLLIAFTFSVYVSDAQSKRLCVIGSSTAYGYFPSPSPAYPQDSGWVSKVKNYYKQLGTVDTVYNLGKLGGRDCYSGMPSSYTPPSGENNPDPNSNITKAVSLVPKPDIIIINYPTNNYDRLSNAEIIECLQTMKDSANANGILCYITTTQPRNSFNTGCRQKLRDLRDTINSVFGLWSIDFFTPVAEEPSLDVMPCYDLGDNIHLNPAGHTELASRVIAKNIFSVVLPVRLENFHARTVNNLNLLTWTAPCCDNRTSFKIEKSSDGRRFETVAVVNAAPPVKDYQYSDGCNKTANCFYRINAVNSDGKEIFSNIIFIPAANKAFVVSPLFPSPTNNTINTQITVKGKQKVNITVTNAAGEQFVQQTIIVNNSMPYSLNISRLPAGNYFLRINSNSNTEVLSFSKQ